MPREKCFWKTGSEPTRGGPRAGETMIGCVLALILAGTALPHAGASVRVQAGFSSVPPGLSWHQHAQTPLSRGGAPLAPRARLPRQRQASLRGNAGGGGIVGLRAKGYGHACPDLGDGGQWTELVQACRKSGMTWGGWKVGTTPDGIRGALALKDIKEDEVIVAAPKDAVLMTQEGDANPLPEWISNECWEDLKGFWNVKMAIRLIWERRLGDKSKFAAYMKVLPEEYSTTLFFSKEEVAELQCPLLIENAKDDQQYFVWVWDRLVTIMPDPPTKEEFFWGLACAGSRTFTADFGTQEPNGEIMCPIADMVNHDERSAPAMRWDSEQEMFELFSPVSLKKGQEVSISYGNVSNAHLLHYYGFVPNENDYDYVPVSETDLIEERKRMPGGLGQWELKEQVLRYLIDSTVPGLTLPLAHFRDSSTLLNKFFDHEIKLGGVLSEHDALLVYCRALCLDEEDTSDGALNTARRLQALGSIGSDNEAAASQLLLRVIRAKEKAMATTLEQDEEIEGKGGLSFNTEQALRFRIRRKRLLRMSAEALEKRLEGAAVAL